MPRQNRIDPFGDLHAIPERGTFTGNRGCLVDDSGRLVRHHQGSLWITCVLSYKDWRSPLAAPHHWTPIFFLDDAVALAAGHRPCGLCRPVGYLSYKTAVLGGAGSGRSMSAVDLNRQLGAERLHRGRGLQRSTDRKITTARLDALPDGAVVVGPKDNQPRLVLADRLLRFDFGGWTDPEGRPADATVAVLTPPTSVTALANGFSPTLHASALS